jgi:hypothetical protein
MALEINVRFERRRGALFRTYVKQIINGGCKMRS